MLLSDGRLRANIEALARPSYAARDDADDSCDGRDSADIELKHRTTSERSSLINYILMPNVANSLHLHEI